MPGAGTTAGRQRRRRSSARRWTGRHGDQRRRPQRDRPRDRIGQEVGHAATPRAVALRASRHTPSLARKMTTSPATSTAASAVVRSRRPVIPVRTARRWRRARRGRSRNRCHEVARGQRQARGSGVSRARRRHAVPPVPAGAHGSRTHRATTSVAPLVLKTGGPTGTPPLPRLGTVAPPAQGSASGRGSERVGPWDPAAAGSGRRLSSGDERAPQHPPIRLTELTSAAAAPRSWERTCWARRWRPGSGGRRRIPRSSPASTRPTTPPPTGSATTWRSSARWTSSRHSWTTRSPTARSPRPTPCRTCSRWVGGCCSRSRSRPSRRTSRGRPWRRCSRRRRRRSARRAACWRAATRSSIGSPSTGWP